MLLALGQGWKEFEEANRKVRSLFIVFERHYLVMVENQDFSTLIQEILKNSLTGEFSSLFIKTKKIIVTEVSKHRRKQEVNKDLL